MAKKRKNEESCGAFPLLNEKLNAMLVTYGSDWIMERVERTMHQDIVAADSPNFKEVETCEEANRVDMEIYRLLSYSDRLGKYVFVKRQRK